MRPPDTYAALEFQGYVVGVPTYDKNSMILKFRAKDLSHPTLQFKAIGQLAKAFKTLLHQGCMIQLTAVPTSHLIEFGEGKKATVIEWEAKAISVLGRKKVKLSGYADRKILDGLMPMEDEITDVGYVEPITFGRFLDRRRKRREKADKALEELNRDKNLL